MLGQPIYMTAPQVVGVRLSGALQSGVTATDLVLTMTERLRKHGVVGKFIEFFGPGLGSLTVADRATISNMSPEFGATASTFPVDAETLRYLRDTGRAPDHVELVERYTKEQGLFRTGDEARARLHRDARLRPLGRRAEPRRPAPAAGPRLAAAAWATASPTRSERRRERRRPRRRVGRDLGDHVVHEHVEPGAHGRRGPGGQEGGRARPHDEAVGEDQPGSRLARRDRLPAQGWAMAPLEALGFNLVGFGCTTCIGNSGPLPDEVAGAIERDDLKVAAVLSRQPQLRGPHPPGGARQLPGVAAARRGLRARRHGERRPHHRAARRGHRRPGLPARRVADRRTR